MRVTPCLFKSKGFVGRSMAELKRYTDIAVNLEGIKGPSGPYELHSFHEKDSVDDCLTLCDRDLGGYSEVNLDWTPPTATPATSQNPTTNPNGHARFHGSISTRLPPDNRNLERSGYAAWRTRNRKPTIFGRSLWDVDPYSHLGIRFKSDGRSYLVNIQTESIVPEDLHQHRLFTKRPGEWETVYIDWNAFVRTNHGFVVEPQMEILRQKVRTIGIGLTDRVEGPFELCIEKIWAAVNPSIADAEKEEVAVQREGELKGRDGKSVKWDD